MIDFSVTWWNTSLYSYASALKKRQLREDYAGEVRREVLNLCKNSDLVFLGEYPNGNELADMLVSLNACLHNEQSLSSVQGESLFYKPNKKLEFHNAVVFKNNIFDLIDEPNQERSITKYRNIPAGRSYRVAQRVRFKFHGEEVGVEFFIVHWNQRDSISGETEKVRKRASADEILARMSGVDAEYPYKMVLGDFNNEPYEEAVQILRGSRSIDYVRKNDALYNPFWKLMHGECGTICSQNNETFHCNKPMFDFFLVNDMCCAENCIVVPEIVSLDMPHRDKEHRPIKLRVTLEV
ncbi:MAG: hypothetical protein K6G91_12825 [Kiritimatiellae bacterium]|nr:hypothetical protein [Kiritimatiellia bacterium]